jgi:hypothetical protein
VFADGNGVIAGATPMTNEAHPELCVIAPDMTILSCDSGHGTIESGLDVIREHAGN